MSKRELALYQTLEEARDALRALGKAGFPEDDVTLVENTDEASDFEELVPLERDVGSESIRGALGGALAAISHAVASGVRYRGVKRRKRLAFPDCWREMCQDTLCLGLGF